VSANFEERDQILVTDSALVKYLEHENEYANASATYRLKSGSGSFRREVSCSTLDEFENLVKKLRLKVQ
jgi:hypothetical protein